MAIPITAGLKVLLSERLQARDAVHPHAAAPGDGQIAAPGQAGSSPTPPASGTPPPMNRTTPHDPARNWPDDPAPAQGAS
jgi:hypothetical protein